MKGLKHLWWLLLSLLNSHEPRKDAHLKKFFDKLELLQEL